MNDQPEKLLTINTAISYIQSLGYGSISGQTIRDWCKKRGIGRKFGGRWVVEQIKLDRLLKKGF